jgi:tetratricopeptide (TPR) repeat protein
LNFLNDTSPSGGADGRDSRDRVIRVFISSTFRDMQAERDYLLKFTFPQLRRLCESRGVTWGEVDLRWGVTDEQSAEGKVLPICLEEIKRCRPYFIGLLGERYGWVPDSVPPELLEAEPWLKEQFDERKSVTELEILHGVLRNPDMSGHAYFYFRDPAYVDTVAADKRKDFTSESADDAKKLAQLKENIRKSGFPAQENYPTPEALGELILKDMTAVIDRLYPEGSQPDPLDREAMEHAAYARSREKVYIGRDAYFKRLNEHAGGRGKQPLVILGESGSGKSALLANWASRYLQTHPEALVLQHYIGATTYSADWVAMLRRIMGEFKRELRLQLEIPDHPDALRSAFPNWMSMASAKIGNMATRYRKIVLVLDALNQLEDRDGAPDLVWLPPVMPENVRLIVSTLPGRPLDEIMRREWPLFHVEPLSLEERQRLINEFLRDYGRQLSRALTDRIAASPQASNPLYLRILLDELRVFGIHDKLEERINYYLKAESPYELYEKVIIRWENDYERDSDLVGDALSLLWAARRGLSETELLEALGENGKPLPRAEWSPLYLAMSDSLSSRGGLLTFSHDFLRTAARDAYIPEEPSQMRAHVRLADYFQNQPAGPRRTDELPWQLAHGGAWKRLQDLLTEQDFFMASWIANQYDVKVYWAGLEEASYRMVDAYRATIDNPDEADDGFVWSISDLLRATGHPVEALKMRGYLTERYRNSGAIAMNRYKTSLGNQANIFADLGEYDEAMSLLKEMERICRERGEKDDLSGSLGNQADILYHRGEYDEAMRLSKEQERICRELGDKEGLSFSLGNQANILYHRGEYDEAMRLYKEQERICMELGHKDRLSVSLGYQANILKDRGELDEAMRLLKDAERISRELGDKDGLSFSLGNQARILKDRGELDEAMRLYKEQERICMEIGDKEGLSVSLGNQAIMLFDREELDEAMRLYKEQERICMEIGNKEGLQASLGNQALIFKARGEINEAMRLSKEQERICRELGNLLGLATSLVNQALLLSDEMGHHKEALPLTEEAYDLAMNIGHIDLAQQIKHILDSIRSR